MELNWSTFALEIINFLILVWLLARFLYRPVMKIISDRQQEIQKKLDAAEALRNEAESLKSNYDERLNNWDREKTGAMKQLQDEIAIERGRLLEELQHELEQERQKAGILNQRQMQDEKRNMGRQALRQGAAFSTRLLTRLAGPDLEARLIEVLIDDLDTLSPEKRQLLVTGNAKNENGITISSAFPITEKNKIKIEQKLKSVINEKTSCTYKHEPELIAGLRIRIGAWLLQANLQDELKYFAEIDHETE